MYSLLFILQTLLCKKINKRAHNASLCTYIDYVLEHYNTKICELKNFTIYYCV